MAANVLIKHPKLDSKAPAACTREAFETVWQPKGWIEVNADGTPKDATAAQADATAADPSANGGDAGDKSSGGQAAPRGGK